MTDEFERTRAFFAEEEDEDGGVPATVGRYQVVREIGRGGMGVVYEALDGSLGRKVALKVLAGGDDARLRREAMAAARLRHPNVVTVYEVGARHIAMEYVEGRPLAELLPAMDVAARRRALVTIAEAVAHGHEHGVVHRDLKPANVLVESGGRLVLTDFGLAKTLDSAELTRAGEPLGTPQYMAPEQVRGDLTALGPATDVWALGVMLVEFETDTRPFDAPSVAEIYRRIPVDEPTVPAGPLGAIATRALAKDPARRYPHAAAFLADVQRFLAGTPIEAPAQRPVMRLLRRHRRGLLIGAGVAAAGAVGLVLRRRSADRLLEAMRAQARLSLEAALELRRAGAADRMRQFLPPLEAAHAQVEQVAPALAEPDYLLGRLHRALLDDRKALAAQERALAKDPRFAAALYERALLLTLQLGRALNGAITGAETAGRITVDVAELERERPDLRIMREKATAASQRFLAAATGPETPLVSLARGLAAYGAGRYAEARDFVEQAVHGDPGLEEGWEALTLVAATDHRTRAADQERRLREEEELLTRRIAEDQGYNPHLLTRGLLRFRRGSRRRHRGLDPTSDYDGAAADFEAVIRLDPRSAMGWAQRGRVRVYRAIHAMEANLDPLPHLAAAQADLNRAIALDARSGFAWHWRGSAHFYRALHLTKLGQDPLAEHAAAEAALNEAVRLTGEGEPRRWRGRARAHHAAALARAGRDHEPLFAAAEKDLTGEHNDLFGTIWAGSLYLERAIVRASTEEGGAADLDSAEKWLARAEIADRHQMEVWRHRGLVHFHRAGLFERRGLREQARRSYAQAAADLTRAISLNPNARNLSGEELAAARMRSGAN